ncbi:MAG: LPS-assembly protein LptD [Hyphomicrobiaceae bacterium]|nr:MAG: LPS-assembly protein LptD [Hyphomicrobiaceae bacterium]
MRRAPIPHSKCGGAPVWSRRARRLQAGCALAFAAIASAVLTFIPGPASAQDPSVKTTTTATKAFPKKAGSMFGPAPKIDRTQPLYLQADQLIYDTKNSRVIAQGNVEIYYNNYILTADQVIYDQSVNKLIAEGNAQLKDPNGSITRADRFEALDDFRDAFVQSLSVITQDDTRIAAERATRREGNINEYERAKFTPCKNDPGMPPLWCIGAARIIHDQRAATITYQDAQFELFGVPIAYLPYFQHADPSVKRRSGFLAPLISNSSTLGFSTEIPYYFALAPNYDFTFHPRYFSKEGILYQGDWRHRLADGQYTVKIAAIDQEGGEERGWRGSLETKGQFSLASWWRFGWDITVESDASFRRYYQLDSILQTDRVNTAYLQGMNDRNYFSAKLYHFGGLLLNDPNYSDSRVLPVVDYNYIWGAPVAGGELSFTGHARSMTRTGSNTDTNHALVEASWRRKMIDPVGQVWTPFGNVRGDVYSYADATDPNNPAMTIPDDTVARGMATAGMLYSYPFVARTASASHVIAPTAQIIVRPDKVSQFRLPDEDAKSLVLDDTLLFDIDKFSGYDRFETGTRANVGVQYTMQANNGSYARAVFGQSYHLAGDNPYVTPGLDPTSKFNFSPVSGLETDRSDYVAGLYLSPFAGFSVISQARFDERDWSLRRQDTLLQASYGPISGSVGYTFSAFDPALGVVDNQEDVLAALRLQLTTNWSVGGFVRYDIDVQKRVQDQFQVKYADECFVLTASYTETFVENAALDLKPDRTLMLRFELKYLGEFNYKTDALDHTFGDTKGNIPQ